VQAFRSAAVVVDAMDDAELERRIRTNTLKDLKGIGPKTAAAIAEALHGRVPE
jgi:putative hydrolase